ncbi:MAG: M12 family metallopeptidase [Planctomycetes bacterium]|nr:M12 family metallopeptidase [Planctomycetota bacterium]
MAARAIAIRNRQWTKGQTLEVSFRGGNSTQQDMVRTIAPEWCKHANLKLAFTNKPSALIRVSFDPNEGAWSYVGRDNESIPTDAATMNLGWQDKAVILHEFGHMIGLAHEHQNPQGGIRWNEAAVIADLSGPPNHWDEATIRHNVLDKYRMDQILGTEFDPLSIMLYSFPAEWTVGGAGTQMNKDLSPKDKAFVGGPQMYPGVGVEVLPRLNVHTPAAAAISQPGEQDVFVFTVVRTGTYVVETHGAVDLVMSLYGPDSSSKLVATDDDSGASRNPRIEASLTPGEYRLQVHSYGASASGPYRVSVVG